MTELETLQGHLAAAKRSYYSGEVMLQHGETRRQRADLAAQWKMILNLEAAIAGLSVTGRRRRVWYSYQSGKGL